MGFTNELESSQSYIRPTMGFDEFSMTFVKSELTIEGLIHTITVPKNSYFHSIGSPLYTVRYH